MARTVRCIPILVVLEIALPANAVDFCGLGGLPPLHSSIGKAVSGDGLVVVGSSSSARAMGSEAFRWTNTEGMIPLGDIEGGTFASRATDASFDGSVIVGDGHSPTRQEAWRWTEASGIVGLGTLPLPDRPNSFAIGVSAGGSVVVGISGSNNSVKGRAFRWTESGGMVNLGLLPNGLTSQARGVSADGSVVVGVTEYITEIFEAFRWTEADGMVGLGDLSGGRFQSNAAAVSADGKVIVGTSISGLGTEAFRWTQAGGMVGLGDLPGGRFGSDPVAVSADGSIVVGYSRDGGPSPTGEVAFVWNEVNGMRNLQDMLVNDLGLNLDGWILTNATGVSDDGNVIVGTGLHDGEPEAWKTHLTGVVDLDHNCFVDFDDLAILLANWNELVIPELGNIVSPTTSLVNFDDLAVLLAAWTGPNPDAAQSPEAALGEAAVPEPSSLLLALLATLGLGFYRRRRLRSI